MKADYYYHIPTDIYWCDRPVIASLHNIKTGIVHTVKGIKQIRRAVRNWRKIGAFRLDCKQPNLQEALGYIDRETKHLQTIYQLNQQET